VGAWSSGPFGNDDALDLVGDLREGTPAEITERLAEAFDLVLASDEYIEAPEMNVAIAAAALVAIRSGAPLPPEDAVQEWLAQAPFGADDDLRGRAADVLQRALEPDDNEWYELWDEAGALDEARRALAPYRAAL
jgi:hypothetical protein